MKEQVQILVVDDEAHILKSLSRLFVLKGFAVLTANSAQTALDILAKAPVDIVISDYRMPGLTGLDLMIQLRKTYPDIVRILLTAFSDREVMEQAINQGEIYRFFSKPWDEEKLLASVREAVAQRQARIMERNDVLQALQQSNMETVMAIAEAVELKDPYTKGHCSRVRGFAMQIAQALGLPEKWIPHLSCAALLHDCGKIGIGETLLLKPGRLSADQRKIVEFHSVLGFELMNSVSHLKTASLFVRQHHERWDGQGYPDGLLQDQSHICSRIIAIADAYDAMTSDRPYRKGMALSKARAALVAGRGSQFDPELVDLFISLLEQGKDRLAPAGNRGAEQRPVLLFLGQDINGSKAMGDLFDPGRFVVALAQDAREALEILDRIGVDVLIKEGALADRSGLALLSEVKARFPGLIRILVSQDLAPEMMGAMDNLGVHKIILSPFRDEELKSAVEKAIERKQMAQAFDKAGFQAW